MARTPGTEAAASLTFFYKMHNNVVTIDKTCEAGSRSTRSHPFQYHRPNSYTDGLKFSFFPRTIVTWNGLGLQPKLSLRRQLYCYLFLVFFFFFFFFK